MRSSSLFERMMRSLIGNNDLEKAKTFYNALLGTLGVAPARVDGHRIFLQDPNWRLFSVSDDARRQIRGKVDVAFDDMGPQNLKNIAETNARLANTA